jgi:hypothetical protein
MARALPASFFPYLDGWLIAAASSAIIQLVGCPVSMERSVFILPVGEKPQFIENAGTLIFSRPLTFGVLCPYGAIEYQPVRGYADVENKWDLEDQLPISHIA